MSKGFSTIFFMIIFCFSSISAQSKKTDFDHGGFARIKSLGNSPFILDHTDILFNPAWGTYFGNVLFGDIGATIANNFEAGGIGQYLTVNFKLSDDLALGAAVARRDFQNRLSIASLDPYGIVNETNNALGTSALAELDNTWVVFGSYDFSGHTLGLGFSYASTSTETKPANGGGIRADAGQLGLYLGYLGKLSPSLKLDLSGVLLFPGTTFENPQSSETNFAQSVIFIHGRGFFKADSKFTIVPYVKLLKTSGSAEIGDATGVTTTDLNSVFSIRLGAGVSYRIDNFLFTGGPSFETLTETTPAVSGVSPELSKSTNSFPIWNFGAEWSMVEWLVARIGYRARTSTISTETVASPTNSNETIVTAYDPNNGGITLGLGFRFSGFRLDATINEDIIRQGFNNLGGGGATFTYVSAAYVF